MHLCHTPNNYNDIENEVQFFCLELEIFIKDCIEILKRNLFSQNLSTIYE